MSLESYKRALRERQYAATDSESNCHGPSETYVVIETRQRSHFSIGCLISFLIFAVIVIVAAVKNPSHAESRELVKGFLVERFDDFVTQNLQNKADKTDLSLYMGKFLANVLSPHLVDAMVKIDVSDWVVFSTFEAVAVRTDDDMKLLSGVIVFGKIIPLDTELDYDELVNGSMD